MKKILTIILLFVAFATFAQTPKANYDVIPLPKSVVLQDANPFILNAEVAIVCNIKDADLERNAKFLADYIATATGLNLKVGKWAKSNICLSIDSSKGIEKEGYEINIDKGGIKIVGSTAQGVFYGIQTFRKSLPIENVESIELPAVVITDSPRYGYRGMHLDCARHFFSLDVVKEFIDLIALHNMNTFHWHLTEDQGWRIEIKKYPKLTQIGSIRENTVLGRNSKVTDDTPHGGFYTQKQAREIVKYAAERYITVIPEIDMPGHMLAALASYPELGCTGGPYKVANKWGIFPDILCAGKEDTFKFVEGVLDEIMDIFPSQYIHIGGDEAPKSRWKECPECQKRIKELDLKSTDKRSAEDLLQGYFTNRVEKYINSKGRKIIGWDEILGGDINQSATIMSWRGMKGGLIASQKGHDVIMTPNTYAYFDYAQIKNSKNEPNVVYWHPLPLSKVYSFEPAPEQLPIEAQNHIIGVQANVWTEYIASRSLIEYQILPRMAAIAESQWMQRGTKNYEQFLNRLPQLTKLYKKLGCTVCEKYE